MDADVRFVRITQLPVTWEAGGRFFESSHMAVAHGREAAWDRSLVIDFGNVHSAPWRFALYDDVTDEEAFVLFQNNVAVEKMLAGDVATAERMLRFLRERTPRPCPRCTTTSPWCCSRAGGLPRRWPLLQAAVEKFPNFRPLYANAVQAARRVGNEQLALALESKGKELLEDEPSWNFNEGMRSYQGPGVLRRGSALREGALGRPGQRAAAGLERPGTPGRRRSPPRPGAGGAHSRAAHLGDPRHPAAGPAARSSRRSTPRVGGC